MPRYNVEADEKWREEQYGAENVPIEQANKKTLAQALLSLSNYHSDEEICANLRMAGLLYPKWEDREE